MPNAVSVFTYTNHIVFLRIFLPLVAVIALAVVIIWPLYSGWMLRQQTANSTTRLRAEEIAMTLPKAGAPAQLQVTKPEFSGVDREQRPFKITADKIIQEVTIDNPTGGAIALDQPKAIMVLDAQNTVQATLQAMKGLYDQQKQTLILTEQVRLTHTDGYVLDMQDLFVDLATGSSKTSYPVQGNGPLGSLSGQSLEVRQHGQHLILHGPSKVILKGNAS